MIDPSVVLLAAGSGRRMGALTGNGPKAMLEVDGKPVIEWMLDSILTRTEAEIVVVVGHEAEVVREHLTDKYGFRVRTALNERYQEDVNIFSVEIGVRALSASERGYLILETDMLVDDSVWDTVFNRMRLSSESFWVCQGQYGPDRTGGIVHTSVGDAIDAIDYQPVYRPEFEGWHKMLGMLFVGPNQVCVDRRSRGSMLGNLKQYYMNPWITNLEHLPCRALQIQGGFAASFNTALEFHAAAEAFLASRGRVSPH